MNNIVQSLTNCGCFFQQDVDLSAVSNTHTGGVVPIVAYPSTMSELKRAIEILRESNVKFVVLGEMTNVAIASGTLDFVVISTLRFVGKPTWNSEKRELSVLAGVKMKWLSRWACKHGIADLQWMEGIPGTVGAGVFMNAGFLSGQDIASFLISVDVLTMNGQVRTIYNQELGFTYRSSILQDSQLLVLRARFLLRSGKPWKIRMKMLQYHHRRQKNQPLDIPSAGTVFLPPTPYHLGSMIPKLGLTHLTVGGAHVSEKSPGFIVGEHMRGEDYYHLVKKIQHEVFETWGINISPEVRMIGFSEIGTLSYPISCSWEPHTNC